MKELLGFRRHGGALPRIIGHRGVRKDGAPCENTLEAFQAAIDDGADAIELDVRVAADGELVVLHDATLERVTAGRDTRAAASLSAAELGAIELERIGRIPTLADVLAFGRAHALPMNVEMKRDVPDRRAVVMAVARLLRRWDPKHALVVSSFDPAMLAALRGLAPSLPLAILLHRTKWHRFGAKAAIALGADAAHIERTIAAPELVRELRAAGLCVNVWTVNHAGEAHDLAGLEIDGIITDTPAELRAALQAE